MFAKTTILVMLLAAALVVVVGCTSADPVPTSPPVQEQPGQGTDGGLASGSRLAPGLYDLEDGSVQALGTLEWVDLEGGFWAIKGGFEAEGTLGETVAVIANGPDFETDLKALEGKTVLVTGTRLDGASVRMAGPEIEISKVEEVSDTPGIAE